jgi:hypothetical protein
MKSEFNGLSFSVRLLLDITAVFSTKEGTNQNTKSQIELELKNVIVCTPETKILNSKSVHNNL